MLAKDPPDEVASPCRSLCKLGPDNICLGCYRKSTEINFWTTLTNAEKREVVIQADRRRREAEA